LRCSNTLLFSIIPHYLLQKVLTNSLRNAAWLLLAAACGPPAASQFSEELQANVVIGIGQSEHHERTDDNKTDIVEKEQWQLQIDPNDSNRLLGEAIRIITISNVDGIPFRCNGRSRYELRSIYQLRGDRTALPVMLDERLIRTEPSPCEHGFRQTTSYALDVQDQTLDVTFADGSQQMQRVQSGWPVAEPPPLDLRGRWISTEVTIDEASHRRIAVEHWQISWLPTAIDMKKASMGATYQRWVTNARGSNELITCANAAAFSYQENAVAEGTLVKNADDELLFSMRELAISRSAHPCLDPTFSPIQPLNEATFELRGDYLVVEWRGKRRQVLHRE
jgi:hypothetical protein